MIAVNDAIFPCFWADWLHAGDAQWWRWHIQEVHTFKGFKTTMADDIPAPWVDGYLEQSGDLGFDPDPTKLRTGSSSTYQAIGIAMHAGAKRIILLGVDMKPAENGDAHWFGDHPDKVPCNFQHQMVPKFQSLKPFLAERDITVLNASPGSALDAFPMVDIGAELKW